MKVAIIGSGFAGLCMGIKLKEAGIDDFVIFEKADRLGGAWRDNTYPGCACDVQSQLYSFSFEQNPNWSRVFSPHNEIWDYMEHCAIKYKVNPHIQYNAAVTSAEYDEKKACWFVTVNGDKHEAQFLVTAPGGLSIPSIPNFKGKNTFKGPAFHSSEWDHDVDLTGKNVAIIGTGASTIQIMPQVAKKAASVNVFQRTPPWVMPKPDRAFTSLEKMLFKQLPIIMWFNRQRMYWSFEFRVLGFVINPKMMKLPQFLAKLYIKKTVKDPETQKKLTPNYTIGCKRILLATDYYQSYNRDNVHLLTEGIDTINPDGITSGDGTKHPADVIVYATGFKATEYLSNVKITGRKAKTLQEVWSDCPEAYLGTTVAGFPNLFLFTGPNTGLGHTSMLVMIEAQVQYIMDCLKKMKRKQVKEVEVKKSVQDVFNKKLQADIAKSVWQDGGCKSWYQTEDGRNPTLWPGFTFTFRNKTRRFDHENYEMK